MTAHRYWRVFDRFDGSGAPITVVAELGLMTTIGGSTVTTGGTPIADSYYMPLSLTIPQAFDGNAATDWASGSNPSAGTAWIGYDFGGSPKDIVEFYIQASATYTNQTSAISTLQYSDNGTDWFDAWNTDYEPTWSGGQTRRWANTIDLDPTAPYIVQSAFAATGTACPVLPNAPTAGNLVLCFWQYGGNTVTAGSNGWTYDIDSAVGDTFDAALYYRYVQPGDSASYSGCPIGGLGSKSVMIVEIANVSGVWSADKDHSYAESPSGQNTTSRTTGHAHCLALATYQCAGVSSVPIYIDHQMRPVVNGTASNCQGGMGFMSLATSGTAYQMDTVGGAASVGRSIEVSIIGGTPGPTNDAALAFTGLNISASGFIPGAGGTGLRQFWTFGN